MMLSPELNFAGIKLRVCSRLEQLRRWWEGPLSLEEIELIAWHGMLNDPWLSTYTMVQDRHGNWVEDRHFVNPKLAYARMLGELGESFSKMAEQIIASFVPAFEQLAEAFQPWLDSLEQSGLMSSLSEEEGVE